MKYRADIDGLRAIAVLPVVLFHAGLPGMPGGFIGVDVFFVISGFLITSIIHREILEERFSFVNFYERRLRRIMPALLAVIAFVIVGSIFLLLPRELRSLPAQVIGSVFFAANIVMWKQSGYFSPEAEEMPLLHIWSLGVEEQFYIFAPVLLLLVLRLAPRKLTVVLVLLTLASFGLSAAFSETFPNASFYLLPTRAWELSAGALVALGILSRPANRLANEVLTVLGLILILGGVFLIDDISDFPGAIAAVPVGGAVLVILCGRDTRAGAMLGSAPLRGIGLISYSLYLWHWPLIVFTGYRGWLDGTASQLAIVLLSLLVAWLSWRFIETPFRDKRRFTRNRIMGGSAIGMFIATVVAVGIDRTEGWPGRWPDQILTFAVAGDDVSPERDRCHRLSGLGEIAETCILGEGDPVTAVWSDSHGVELTYALGRLMPVRQISYTSCAPALGMDRTRSRMCRRHNDRVIDYLTGPDSNIETVILAAWYDDVLDRPGFREGFRDSVDRLSAAGLEVIVVSQLPRPGYIVPRHLARGGERTFPYARFEPVHARIMDFLTDLEADEVFDPTPLVCSGPVCDLVVDGHATLFDSHHPSMSMARKIADALVEKTDLEQVAQNLDGKKGSEGRVN